MTNILIMILIIMIIISVNVSPTAWRRGEVKYLGP